MQVGSVTTPFGRRSMTLGMLAAQYKSQRITPDQSVDKWKIFRALCEAKPLLGLSDRALAVLNALLSFYPGNELSAAQGLVIFPSNAQLSIRAHGIAAATLRRHLAALVEAGLLVRKDSPNGKRYARRDGEGEIGQAYGFSIAPLIARAAEIQSLAAQVTADRELFRASREQLSLCRRDIAKLIETALEEGVSGDWTTVYERFRTLVLQIPRSPTINDLMPILKDMEMLRQEVVNLLEIRLNAENMRGNESHAERHIQNSKPESIYNLEPISNSQQIRASSPSQMLVAVPANSPDEIQNLAVVSKACADEKVEAMADKPSNSNGHGLKSFPLSFVLQACPEIVAYGPGGNVGSWRDLMAAAIVVHTMLQVSPSAYRHACGIMGPENAATVMACVLQRAEIITSAGGYLRDLTRRTERGEFAIGPMLMALARAKSGKAACVQ